MNDLDYKKMCDQLKKEDPVIDLENDPINAKCLKCTQTCKQSHKVHVLACDYKQKGV